MSDPREVARMVPIRSNATAADILQSTRGWRRDTRLRREVAGMIDWTTSDELAAKLRGYSPIGLRLRPFLHGKYDDDPTTALPLEREVRAVDGLGTVKSWSGFVDDVPFTITCMSHPHHHGLEVSLPVVASGDRRLFVVLTQLALPRSRSLYIDTPPVANGYGVASGSETPIYSASNREDADAALAFAQRASDGEFRIVTVTSSDPVWRVVGPPAGAFVSEVASFTSVAAARRHAVERSRETGAAFEVFG